MITISFEGEFEDNYSIINTLGQIVAIGKEITNEKQIRISVSNLKTGNYILQMQINGIVEKVKFVKL
jgi:hypothetical protein